MNPNDPQEEMKLREARREIRNRLIEMGIEPNDFFQSATLGIDHGGEHKDTVARTLSQSLDEVEDWKRIRTYTEPEQRGHHYRTGWQIVEWSETADDWIPVQFRPTDGDNSIIETDPQTVPYTEFSNWLTEQDDPPLAQLTLTDTPREEVPSVFNLILTKLASTCEVRIEAHPNTIGDAYDVTWELIQWRGDLQNGEWVVIEQ